MLVHSPTARPCIQGQGIFSLDASDSDEGTHAMQGQWADGDHLPGTLQGQYTPDQLQLLCLSQVPQRPHVPQSRPLPSRRALPHYEHAHVPLSQQRAAYRLICAALSGLR